jgi:ribosomal protein S27E
MGAAPSRGTPAPVALKATCPACGTEVAVTAAPPVKLPCPKCGRILSIRQG